MARIAKYYRRESVYIPPPVETSRFSISPDHDDYFLIVSRLVPYKRIDLAVQAFSALGLPLRIIGKGRDEARLRKMAAKNVTFLGHLPDEEVRRQMSRCRAFVFPGEEDFGITPVEAQACGRPVIAYGAGGALAMVREGVTGVFFREQTPEALADAVRSFRDEQFDPAAIRRHAEEFDTTRFNRRFLRFVDEKMGKQRIASQGTPTFEVPVTRMDEPRALQDEETAKYAAPFPPSALRPEPPSQANVWRDA
jgi:glycosyltransferase involved in cell wall biosynthesis